MSRNSATLKCPKCGYTYTEACLWVNPVCPKCDYRRDGDETKPKFTIEEA